MTRPGLLLSWERVRRSAMLYGALGTVVRVGANVLLLPVVLRKLSASELALWWVFVALGALANLADFGFGTAIIRVYSYFWAGSEDYDTEGLRTPPTQTGPNWNRLGQLHATARVLYRWLALGGTSILALGGTWFLWRSAQAAVEPWRIWVAWAGYVIAIGYTLGTIYWTFACQGINQVRELQAAYLWSGLSYLVAAAVLLELGFGLFSMVIATAVKALLCRECCRRAYRGAVSGAACEPAEPNLSLLRRIWPNAWKFGFLSLGAFLVSNSSVLISSHFLGDKMTASYGLTTQVGTFIGTIATMWLTVKWPQITILRSQGKLMEMGVLFARRLTWAMLTFTVLAVILVLLGNRILEWKGTHTRLLSTSYLVVYLFYLGQQLFYVQFGTLTFTENVVPFFKIALFTGLGLTLLSLVLTPWLGLWGLVLTPLIATLACSSWYPVWRGFKGQPLTIRQFMRASLCGRL